MKTAPHLCYSSFNMKIEYQEVVATEAPSPWTPLDYGCIDAPEYFPAGSFYSHKYMYHSGSTPMPTAVSR